MLPDRELDRLYGLSLAEFTRARDQLARDLKNEGESDAAAEAKGLAKPSISAWTVNRLAREEPLQVRALMTAGERLRKAQSELLGGGDPEELQAALQRQRDVIGALLESARRILAASGHPATDATLERIRATLTATAADEEGARLVELGRLTKDLELSGFGGPGVAPRTPARRAAPGKRKENEARKRRVEAAKRKVGELTAEVAAQQDLARRLTSEARKAESQLERLTARLEAARDALARAKPS